MLERVDEAILSDVRNNAKLCLNTILAFNLPKLERKSAALYK